MKVLTAKWVVPITSPPFEDGAVVFDGDSIVALGDKREILEEFPNASIEDFGDAAILPAFINCHSHLELSAMRGFLDNVEENFIEWLLKLTNSREVQSEADRELSAIFGATEGARSGISFFADIARFGKASFSALKTVGLRGITYQETEFSPSDQTAKVDFAKLAEKIENLCENETEIVKVGISPHAPYTVSPKLFELIAEYSLEKNLAVSIHAAESTNEELLMRNGNGVFADYFDKQNISWKTPETSTIKYLAKLGVLQTKPLLAHCVNVDEEDLDLISKSDSSIAHCPKSNAKFCHGIAPLGGFLNRNLRVGIGSDSVVSNNTCDLIEEVRFASLLSRTKNFHVTAEQSLRLATIDSARAVGMEREIGSLEVGKKADFAIVSFANTSQMPIFDVYSAIVFASSAQDVKATIVAGKTIYENGVVSTVDENEIKAKILELANKIKTN